MFSSRISMHHDRQHAGPTRVAPRVPKSIRNSILWNTLKAARLKFIHEEIPKHRKYVCLWMAVCGG